MSAPVRTEGLFWRPHGCNIATGKDPLSEAVAEVLQRFFENFSATDFSPHLRRASCTFVRQIGICPTKVLALRGRSVLPSRTPFEPILWIPTENWQTWPTGTPERRVINTRFGLMKSRISASTNCFVKPDRSITAAGLSSKESSAKSSSSSDATLRKCSLLPGWMTFISNFKSWGITVCPSRRYNKYSDGKLLGKCSLQITYHQPTYLKGKPDRECSMSG